MFILSNKRRFCWEIPRIEAALCKDPGTKNKDSGVLHTQKTFMSKVQLETFIENVLIQQDKVVSYFYCCFSIQGPDQHSKTGKIITDDKYWIGKDKTFIICK